MGALINDGNANVERFDAFHALWQAYVAHLKRVDMARWGVTTDGMPLNETVYLGISVDGLVVSHISLKKQPIKIPGTEQIMCHAGGKELNELYVQTFAVEETCRRRGYGRALQLAALELLSDLDCYQMRSWSSLDKPANYALKISLGFAICPAIYETPTGEKISGVYFVKTRAG